MRLVGMRVLLAVVAWAFTLGTWTNAWAVEKNADESGFVAFLSSEPDAQGRHRVDRVTRVAGSAGDLGARIDGARSWRVRLLAEDGRVLSEVRVGDPTVALIGAEQARLPLVVRFPDAPGAILVEVLDGEGRLRAEVPLDEAARAAAQDNLNRAHTKLTTAAQRVAVTGAVATEARQALERQLAAQARLAEQGAAGPCPAAKPWRAPEIIAGPTDCGATADGQPEPLERSDPPGKPLSLTVPGARPAAYPPTVAELPTEATQELIRYVKDGVIANASVRVRGQIRFPEGVAPPVAGFNVWVWGADGNPNSGYGARAEPPEFRFERSVVSGASIRLQPDPPLPFRKTSVQLGAVNADTERNISLEKGTVVAVQFRVPEGVAAPSTGFPVAFWGADGNPNHVEYAYANAPDFRVAVAVKTGASIRVDAYPSAPFIRVQADLGVVSADTQRDIPLQRGAVISGRLRFPDGVPAPTQGFSSTAWGLENPNQGIAFRVEPPQFAYSLAAKPGATVRLDLRPPTPFLRMSSNLGVVNVDTQRDITLQRGAVISGRLRFPTGVPAPTQGFWSHAWGLYGHANSGADFRVEPPGFAYSLAAKPGAAVRLDLRPPAPFLPSSHELGVVSSDLVANLQAVRGVQVNGSVRAVGAALPSSYWVLVTQPETGESTWHVFSSAAFQVALPPRGATVEVHASGFRASAGFTPTNGNDATHEFLLEALSSEPNVRVRVTDQQGRLIEGVRLEVWRKGKYYTSSAGHWSTGSRSGRGWADGEARLDLPDGEYELRAWPGGEYASDFGSGSLLFAQPAAVKSISVSGPTTVDIALPASAWIFMPVLFPLAGIRQDACTWLGPMGRMELLQDGRVVARGAMKNQFRLGEASAGYLVVTSTGRWTLRFVMPSEGVYESEPFLAKSGREIRLRRVGGPWPTWTGVLRDHAGNPQPDRTLRATDELGVTFPYPVFDNTNAQGVTTRIECAPKTDAGGRFQLPLCRGCAYEFKAKSSSPALRRIVPVDEPVTGDRVEDLLLGRPLPFSPLADTGVSRVYGTPDAPIRILFLAEGYVAERETFTDSNGNGIWDGVQFVDANGNGVWDSGEFYARYGTAAPPVNGQDPRLSNEVIQDQNGDGVLSLDDRALFERNVQDYLRGLLSSHQFDRYRHAYQANAVMGYSKQAGMDHGDLWQRDTRFNASYVRSGGLLTIDYTAATEAALAADPGYTVIVVMINQPVPYGRVNSFILASGGALRSDVNDLVGAHEFGHNPGRLADEYAEFTGAHTGVSPGGMANSTRFVERALVAWGRHVPAENDGRPSRDFMQRTGFFEGSSRYPFGAFRPSQASVMRFIDSVLFNQASVDQLEKVHGTALRGRPGLLEVEGARDCRGVSLRWDATGRGVDSVLVRRGSSSGPVVAKGGVRGQSVIKPGGGDLHLLDAATNAVLDVEAEVLLGCVAPPVRPSSAAENESLAPASTTPAVGVGSAGSPGRARRDPAATWRPSR